MSIETDRRRLPGNENARGRRLASGVPVAVILTMALTVVGAGLAVTVGPRGVGQMAASFSPMREAALRVSGGSQKAGAMAIRANGCAACHAIPGIESPVRNPASTGLESYPMRQRIAGSLHNTPENLALWLQDPQRFTPQSHGSDLQLDSRTAANIAAYLYRGG